MAVRPLFVGYDLGESYVNKDAATRKTIGDAFELNGGKLFCIKFLSHCGWRAFVWHIAFQSEFWEF